MACLIALQGAILLNILVEPALASPRTISKAQLRTQLPAETHRELRDVFWDMIEQGDHRRDTPPRRALTDVWLETRLLPTRVPGLCRYDALELEFEPVEGGYDTPRAQARPVGFEAASYFVFHSQPTRSYAEIVDHEGVIRDECTAISKDGQFFQAATVQMATDGYLALEGLKQKLRSGEEGWLECDLYPADTLACAELIASLGADDLNSINRCEPEEDLLCYELAFGNRRLRVYAPFGAPTAVASARLDSLIVIWHERID